MSAETPDQPSPEQKEKWVREARADLTNEFVSRAKYLSEHVTSLIKQAVIDGNFNELHILANQLNADIKRLEEGYQQHWKDLGSDKK